jgi:hypothetical protein
MTVEMLLGLIEGIEARLRRAPYEVKSTPFLIRLSASTEPKVSEESETLLQRILG